MANNDNRKEIDAKLEEAVARHRADGSPPPDRDYLTLHFDVSGRGPSITLMRGGGQRMFVKRVEPQPPGLPPDLVLVEMPSNVWIDPEPLGADAGMHICSVCGARGTEPSMKRTVVGHVCLCCDADYHSVKP